MNEAIHRDRATDFETVKEALRHLAENSTAGILRKESALRAVARLEAKRVDVDQQTADYRPTRGKLDKPRASADSVIHAIDKGGAIQLDTLAELLELLGTKTDYRFHVAVEVLPTGSGLLKTIDNERDAKETIRRLKAKP